MKTTKKNKPEFKNARRMFQVTLEGGEQFNVYGTSADNVLKRVKEFTNFIPVNVE